jgi:hypothetical protein
LDHAIMNSTRNLVAAFVSCVAAGAQSHQVVPAAFASTDACRFGHVGGSTAARRAQTLVGASHLTQLVDRDITAIEFRRSAEPIAFDAGALQVSLSLSSMAVPTYDCSNHFASNVNTSNEVQVFQGQVSLPASPAEAGPSVAWSADNTIRIAFQTPFHYTGGRLCVDLTGLAVPGLGAGNWVADFQWEDATGTFANLGGGCGPLAQSSDVEEFGLCVGGHTKFTAFGTANSLAFAVTGQPLPPPGLPLASLGLSPAVPDPQNCSLRINMQPDVVALVFMSDVLSPTIGLGQWFLEIPNNHTLQGLSLATQWFDLATQSTTDGISWSIGSAPQIDMATVEGDAQYASGRLSAHVAAIIRFEYQ